MEDHEKIKTVIVDDDENYLCALKEQLEYFPEIELLGCAKQYHLARRLLLTRQPDLVFMDIEMPFKNGFELIHEAKEAGKGQFSVIFYTAYDRYMIQALRESALDFILKPLKIDELKNAIERYKIRKEENNPSDQIKLQQGIMRFQEIVSLPTILGLRFLDKNAIVLFQSVKTSSNKASWEALLNNREHVRLKLNTTANEIKEFMGIDSFIQISQSVIVNLSYLNTIEYTSKKCILLPPFNKLDLTVSRLFLSELKGKFDVL